MSKHADYTTFYEHGRKPRPGDTGTVLLLDVREPHEVDAGYIDGSLPIPMDELPDRMDELPLGKRTVVYCLHGMRSLEIAAWLKVEHGFEDVGTLDGGIVNWYAVHDQTRIVVNRSEDH